MKKTKSAPRKTSRKKPAAKPAKARKKRIRILRAIPVVIPIEPIEIAPAPVPSVAAMRLLKLGRKGDDVAQWQQFLVDHGFVPGRVDGFFGGATRLATIEFQKQHHLAPDGVVGGSTREAAAPLGFAAPATGLEVHGGVNAEDDIAGFFRPNITVFKTRDGRAVYCKTGMNIDADGAYRAYKIRNLGLDYDDNGKDPCAPSGHWIGVVTDGAGRPIPQQAQHPAPGYLISTTSLEDQTRAVTDPLRYVDSESVPYIVLPGGHLDRASLGDYAMVVNTETGKIVHAIAADAGPKNKIGEASIAVARALLGEAASNPRRGGTERPIIRYIVFPNSKDHVFPASDPREPAILEHTLMHINTMAATLFAALDPAHQTALLA
jgi:hypothetical protein